MSAATSFREWPILMRGDLVRATIEGRKTQTRRVPVSRWKNLKVGDRLWVRETWCHAVDPISSRLNGKFLYRADPTESEAILDDGDGSPKLTKDGTFASPWRPSIFMPRAACRLILEVTAHRVEELLSITEQDANDEGIQFMDGFWLGSQHPVKGTPKVFHTAKSAFIDGWDRLNSDRGYGSKFNPEVKVITYRITA